MASIYDKHNMLGVIHSLPDQLLKGHSLGEGITLQGNIDKIAICGMGGSSISGQLLESYFKSLEIQIPIFNIQDYHIPEYLDKNSLVFITSYSGNTEESLSCYKDCMRKGLKVIAISTGGKLCELSKTHKTPHITIPEGYQPRNAIAFLFMPMLKVLESARIIPDSSKDVRQLIDKLKKNNESYTKIAEELSKKLFKMLPVVYSSSANYPLAYRWKCEFNENTKIPAFCHKFPEMNHNELNGYVNYLKLGVPIHILMFKDDSDHHRIKKRMNVSKKLIKEITGNNVQITEVELGGNSVIAKMFTTIYLGDLISYYLALAYETDPSPVDVIEKFKKEMGPFV